MSKCPKCRKEYKGLNLCTEDKCFFRKLPYGNKTAKDFIHKQKKGFSMEKAIKFIKDTLAGENKVGELIHGLADLLPIPNQAIAKAVKALLSGNVNEAKAELPNIFTTRNIVALVASIAYLLGWITLEDIKNLVNALGGVL